MKTQSYSEEAGSQELEQFRGRAQQEREKQEKRDAAQLEGGQAARMQALKRKIVSLFQERDVSFFDCFKSLYDPLNPKASIISVSEFKKRIRQLNLPLSVQDHRLLRRVADPGQIGKVEIKAFCSFFETPELRLRRLHKILDKVATAFYLQGFNMRRAFALFDADGDGAISAKEFRQGMGALNLHLRYDEIDDLMQLVSKNREGQISYDDFISAMDVKMDQRKDEVLEYVEEAFFAKLGEAISYNRDNLEHVMQDYDFNKDDTIEATDLPKVVKKLGIMNPDPHMESLLNAGGCRSDESTIAISQFATALEADMLRRKKAADSVHEKLLQKIYAALKSRNTSVFEFFVTLDVNQSGTVSNLELKTGI